jgi:hypothetical protein
VRGEAETYVPPMFAQSVQQARDEMPGRTVRELLGQAQQPPFRQLVRDADVKPDDISVSPASGNQREKNAQDNPLGWDFPLWQLKELQNLDDNHPPFRLDLWLEAGDTDADEPPGPDGAVRPHLSKSKETFSFLIVPENTLLTKIGEDQAKQYAALNQRFQTLQEKVETVKKNITDLGSANVKVSDLISTSVRAQQVNETLENTLATTTDVYRAYVRIVREEQLNVIRMDKITDTEEKIVDPLKAVIDGDFPPVLDANGKFRKVLDDRGMSDKDRIDASRAAGKDVTDKLTTLLNDLEAVLREMKGKESLEKLAEKLQAIADGVQHSHDVAKGIAVQLQDKFFDEPMPPKKP